MSTTLKNADAVMKLLDNGWTVSLFKNQLGSYTAVAVDDSQTLDEAMEIWRQITDDFTPSQALYRLSEKMIGNIVGGE